MPYSLNTTSHEDIQRMFSLAAFKPMNTGVLDACDQRHRPLGQP